MKALMSLLVSAVVMLGGLVAEMRTSIAPQSVRMEATAVLIDVSSFIYRAAGGATIRHPVETVDAAMAVDDATIYRL